MAMGSIRDLFVSIGIQADERGLQKLEKGIGDIKSGLANLVIGFGAATAAAVGFVKTAGEMEQLEIALETITGSAETAAGVMNELKEITLETPFAFEQTAQAAKRLLAAGSDVKDLRDEINILGNISAGVGRDKFPFLITAFSQIRSAGRLLGQEFNQLRNANVNILPELQKVTGYTEKEMVGNFAKLNITFDQVRQAMSNMTSEGGKFHNLMQKQSKSTLGLISILKDEFFLMSNDIGKELLPVTKDIVVALMDFVRTNKEIIKSGAVKFFKKIGSVLKFVAENAFILKSLMWGLFSVFSLIMTMGIIKLFVGLTNVMTGMFTILSGITTASLITVVTWGLLVALGAAFLGLLEDIYVYFSGGKSLIGEMAKFNPVLKTILDFLGAIGKQVAAVAALLTGQWRAAWNLFRDSTLETLDVILKFFGTNLNEQIQKFTQLIISAIDKIKILGRSLKNIALNVGKFLGFDNPILYNLANAGGVDKGSGSTSNTSAVTNVGDVNISIQGGTNASAADIGNAVKSELNNVIFEAQIQNQSLITE